MRRDEQVIQRTCNGTPVWISGSGPAVVLIHGVLMDHRMWAPQVRALQDKYKLVCFDMLGHGQAPDPQGPRHLADFVVQAREVITEVCPGERVVLGGFSMGGLVSQTYAAQYWQELQGLILLNTVHGRSEREREAVRHRLRLMETGGVENVIEPAMNRWFTDEEKRERSTEVAEVVGWMRDGSFAQKMKAYRVFVESDTPSTEVLNTVQCPALVMTGDNDVGSPAHMSQAMATALPNAELHILDHQQHMMPFLDAKRVCEKMGMFLQRLPR